MDVFSVKAACAFAREYCLSGKGPFVLEASSRPYSSTSSMRTHIDTCV